LVSEPEPWRRVVLERAGELVEVEAVGPGRFLVLAELGREASVEWPGGRDHGGAQLEPPSPGRDTAKAVFDPRPFG
jgi:hypothetical protein